MTALAPIQQALAYDGDRLGDRIDEDAAARRFGHVESPWRAPFFYLSFIAVALLMLVVGMLVLWRVASGSRSV